MHWLNLKILPMLTIAAAVAGCSSSSQAASGSEADRNGALLADKHYLAALHREFVETSGKDYVEFRRGSAVLDPPARFRLERQALWLDAYPMIAVRLVASGDGFGRIADRRIAMARGRAVRDYLIEVGVRDHQLARIDVAAPSAGPKQRVTTQIDPSRSASNE